MERLTQKEEQSPQDTLSQAQLSISGVKSSRKRKIDSWEDQNSSDEESRDETLDLVDENFEDSETEFWPIVSKRC